MESPLVADALPQRARGMNIVEREEKEKERERERER